LQPLRTGPGRILQTSEQRDFRKVVDNKRTDEGISDHENRLA
jgi:hypothetical protein